MRDTGEPTRSWDGPTRFLTGTLLALSLALVLPATYAVGQEAYRPVLAVHVVAGSDEDPVRLCTRAGGDRRVRLKPEAVLDLSHVASVRLEPSSDG